MANAGSARDVAAGQLVVVGMSRWPRESRYQERVIKALVVGLLTVAIAGCGTTLRSAERAFARADYVGAAEQYAVLLENAPGDVELRKRRDEARVQALFALAARVHAYRTRAQWEPAMTSLRELLARRSAWRAPNHPGVANAITAEVTAINLHIEQAIQQLADEAPIAAQAALMVRRRQLDVPELAASWDALTAHVQAAGEARCRSAAPDNAAQAPYLTRLASAYCAHFGVALERPAILPNVIAGLSIDGEIAGMTGAQRAQLVVALDNAMRETPWFGGASLARVELTGHQAAAYNSIDVQLSAPWQESETYTDRESYQEPYQEHYTEYYQTPYQESYTVQVPHTTYSTQSYSCGYGSTRSTCTRSVSSTSSRSETRYRTSYRSASRMATRTRYRTAWRTVTRTRMVMRAYEYEATERTGNYNGTWNLAVMLADVPPLHIQVADRERKVGYDHDASFPAANVSPARAELPDLARWSAKLLPQLRANTVAQLVTHWKLSFCARPSFDAETAARCAYGAVLPQAGRQALATAFGNDVDRVIYHFASWRVR